MIIRADYSAIDARLCDLARIVVMIRKEIEFLEEVIENLGIFWDSEASEEYAVQITADLVVVSALAEKAGITVQAIRGAIEKLDNAELQVGEIIMQL